VARRHVYLRLIFLDEGRKLPLKDTMAILTMTLLITTVLIMTILMTLNMGDIIYN
jgi:hypothetical protein